MDKADKMLSLTEGTCFDVQEGAVIYKVNTSRNTFVLCGAFSTKVHDVVEKAAAGSRIGFGAVQDTVQPYARPLGEADLIAFGVMPEFLSRMQRIVSLGL